MSADYLDTLVQFLVTRRIEDLPGPVVHAAKRVFMDVLGADLRGSEEAENVRLAQHTQAYSAAGRATSTLLRAGFPKVDELSAALANGTQAPSAELDDGYRFSTAHSGAYVLPGTLAMAEALDRSGADMLVAFVLGYDMASRGAAALRTPKFLTMGHGLFSALGTAVAVAKLKDFPADRMRETINIAASLGHVASYSVLKAGATVRNFWTGAGARDGILATNMVEWGFTGLPDGMATTYGLLGPFEPERIVADLGVTYCITQNYHKQYACNGNFDAGIESTLRIMRDHHLRPSDLRRIKVDIFAPYHTLDVAHPCTTLGAKFSLRYAVAAAAVFGHANHEAFTRDALANPEVRRVADLTELHEAPEFAAVVPKIRPSRVTIETVDGRSFQSMTEDPRGHFEKPFSDQELTDKFDRLAGRYLRVDAVKRVRSMVMDLENLRSARELTDAMRAGSLPPVA